MKNTLLVTVAAVSLFAGATGAVAADVYRGDHLPAMKDGPANYAPVDASNWWIDGGVGGSFTTGTAKGDVTGSITINPANITHTHNENGSVTYTSATPIVVPGTAVTRVTITANDNGTYTATYAGKAKSHISYSGLVGEVRGGYKFQLGGGWFMGPAIGIGYSANGDSVTYSGALEFGKRWGNAQLKIGAGYMGQHTAGTAFTGASFSEDVGGFEGLVQADLFLNKNTSIFIRGEEIAEGKFNARGNGYAYDVSQYDTRIMGGVGFHW